MKNGGWPVIGREGNKKNLEKGRIRVTVEKGRERGKQREFQQVGKKKNNSRKQKGSWVGWKKRKKPRKGASVKEGTRERESGEEEQENSKGEVSAENREEQSARKIENCGVFG